MREIKFRAWHKQEKKIYACAGFLSGQVVIVQEDGKVLGKKDDDFILIQFTGLLDKNGKEIYEGDIVREGDMPCLFVETGFATSKVSLLLVSDGKEVTLFSRTDSLEVIGNLYENPELVNHG